MCLLSFVIPQKTVSIVGKDAAHVASSRVDNPDKVVQIDSDVRKDDEYCNAENNFVEVLWMAWAGIKISVDIADDDAVPVDDDWHTNQDEVEKKETDNNQFQNCSCQVGFKINIFRAFKTFFNLNHIFHFSSRYLDVLLTEYIMVQQ